MSTMITAYTKHGETSSAKKNRGCKLKLTRETVEHLKDCLPNNIKYCCKGDSRINTYMRNTVLSFDKNIKDLHISNIH